MPIEALQRLATERIGGAALSGVDPVRLRPDVARPSHDAPTRESQGFGERAAVVQFGREALSLARQQFAEQDANGADTDADAEPAARDATRDTPSGAISEPLTEEQSRQVAEMRRRDREVRTHEQAHKSAGGQHAGAIRLEYAVGADGKRYAVGGSVPIDASPVDGDPQATLRKMEAVHRAATAPAEPSGADQQVAAQAASTAQRARAELATERYKAQQSSHALGLESSGAARGSAAPAARGAPDASSAPLAANGVEPTGSVMPPAPPPELARSRPASTAQLGILA